MIEGTLFKDKNGKYFTYGDMVRYKGSYYTMIDNTAQRIKLQQVGMRRITLTVPHMVEVPEGV